MRPRRLAVLLAPLVLNAFFSCAPRQIPKQMGDVAWGVEVTWHGQSCFTFRDSLNRTIVIDPFDDTVGYGRLKLRADALLITHDHFDHNEKKAVKSRLRDIELVESTNTVSVAGDMYVTGIPSFHDDRKGQSHGENRIYLFTLGGLRIVHLGDLGQDVLTPAQVEQLGTVDVLCVPVGGVTTIDAKAAQALVDRLKPGAVFPMHYGNIRFYRLAEVTDFTRLFKAENVKRPAVSTVRMRKSDLTATPQVFVLSPTERND